MEFAENHSNFPVWQTPTSECDILIVKKVLFLLLLCKDKLKQNRMDKNKRTTEFGNLKWDELKF